MCWLQTSTVIPAAGISVMKMVKTKVHSNTPIPTLQYHNLNLNLTLKLNFTLVPTVERSWHEYLEPPRCLTKSWLNLSASRFHLSMAQLSSEHGRGRAERWWLIVTTPCLLKTENQALRSLWSLSSRSSMWRWKDAALDWCCSHLSEYAVCFFQIPYFSFTLTLKLDFYPNSEKFF